MKSRAVLRSREEDEASAGEVGEFRLSGEPNPEGAGVFEVFGGLMERSVTGDTPRSWWGWRLTIGILGVLGDLCVRRKNVRFPHAKGAMVAKVWKD